MKGIFPRLQATNVAISYQTNSSGASGFVGQTYYGDTTQFALPMNVTVQIQCMTHQFYFLSGLMHWVFSTPPKDALGNTCSAGTGPWMPPTATTMQSESLYTD
jgi:hypothetical protein